MGGDLMNVLSKLLGGGGGGKGSRGKGGYKKRSSVIGAASKKKPETLVWIGGLPKVGKNEWKDANKELQGLIKAAGLECKFVDIGWKGTGSAVMGSAEDATNAIATLAGSQFRGSTLEFDAWAKKEK